MQNRMAVVTLMPNGFASHQRHTCIGTTTVSNETWRVIMNIRILAASALALATLTGSGMAEPGNGNWEKCPGGFDPATSACLSRDKFDRAFPKESTRSSGASAISDPFSNQGGENVTVQ
jgi:hypothetical protein